MSFTRPILVAPAGLAPDVVIVDGSVYVAYGQQNPSALVLVQFDTIGTELSRKTLPDGFFNSFPRFGGAWLAYKRGDPTYGPLLINISSGLVQMYPGVAGGNFPIAVNYTLGVVAYQNGSYPIWLGDFAGGSAASGLPGAPDGLDTVISRTVVTLRKDTRASVPGIFYPVHAGDVTVGEWVTAPYGLGVQLMGDVLRVALAGQDCPTPRCASDGTTYAFVTGGPSGVRLWLGPRADVSALPAASSFPPIPPIPPDPPKPPVTGEFMIDPKTVILYKGVQASSRAGCVNFILHDGSVFSCQSDGTPGSRPAGTDGPWEQGQQTGSLVTFNSNGGFFAFGCAPLDKVL